MKIKINHIGETMQTLEWKAFTAVLFLVIGFVLGVHAGKRKN